ncbi:MAG: family oxidoreductase [Hydrocarboniphaga sp.]|uniref:SDR family oxidoreductase n=1 Tax=Hydrocarboniphaga sp. TaxID=2033016 RepID=UPI002608018D|nr:SDR family oxidoreductase [Hydrocarboniphaga sp.]MDB5971372.1 family oxidoreductase [Hydrocarboniphaga sp.]
MDLGIAGKVAFVSGGTKGIGRATAELFAKEGCKVIVTGRGQEGVDEAVDSMKAAGGTVAGIAVDLTKASEVKRAVEFARDTFGPPDIAVTNVHLGAGGADGEGNFDTLKDEDYTRAFNDLAMSVVHLTRAVIPHMKQQRWGRLINVGSAAAKEPPPEMEHLLHNVARAPVVVLNKTLANDLGPFGITVNTVGTGWILTPSVQRFADELKIGKENMDDYIRKNFHIPANRFGLPEEEGALIVFLASQYAGYITGCWIPVDGGFHRSAW